ncbi:MAG: hypothetical protein ACRCYE_12035 [Sarcina sp.]
MINMYLKYILTDDQLMESFDTLIDGMGVEDERVKKKLKSKLKLNFEKNIDIDFIDGVFYNKNTENKTSIEELIKVVELENVLVLKFSTKGNLIIPLTYIRENENYKNVENEFKKIARENKKKMEAKDYSQDEVLNFEGMNAKKQYVVHQMFNLKQRNQYMYIIFFTYMIGIVALALSIFYSNIYNFTNLSIQSYNPYETVTWILILCLLIFSIGIKFGLNKFFESKIKDKSSNTQFEFGEETLKVRYANIEKTFLSEDIYGYEIKNGYLIIYVKQKKGFEFIEILLSKIDKNLKKEICRRIEEINLNKDFTEEVRRYIKRKKKKRKRLFIILIVIIVISFLIAINALAILYMFDQQYFDKIAIAKSIINL